jgi:uncharacterized protein with PQ loop repeat
MESLLLDWSGYLAAILMVISPVVQLVETQQKKTVKGLSLWMLVTLFIGCLIMGIRILLTSNDIPLLLNYGFNVIIVGWNIWLFYLYRNKK